MPLDRGASRDSESGMVANAEPSILTPPPAMVKSLGRKNLEPVKLTAGAVWGAVERRVATPLTRKSRPFADTFSNISSPGAKGLGKAAGFREQQNPSSAT